MYRLFCNKCGKEIRPKEMIMNIEMGEQDYLGERSTRVTSCHRNFDLHLCNDCRQLLLQFLNIEEKRKPSLGITDQP